MATFDYAVVGFPTSPTTGDYLIIGSITYRYTAKGAWDVASSGESTVGGAMISGIIPDTDNAYDIGSAGYKIRDVYISENSLWLGDNHKISVSGGRKKTITRKFGKTPKKIFDALIGPGKAFENEDALLNKFKADIHDPVPDSRTEPGQADFHPSVKNWLDFAAFNGQGIFKTPAEIFDDDEDFEDEGNTVSATDPLVTTNPAAVGHLWINSVSGETFVCKDATTNANVWVNGNTDPNQISSIAAAIIFG